MGDSVSLASQLAYVYISPPAPSLPLPSPPTVCLEVLVYVEMFSFLVCVAVVFVNGFRAPPVDQEAQRESSAGESDGEKTYPASHREATHMEITAVSGEFYVERVIVS